MKPLLEVEKTRIAYHKNANKNTVHRSSLIVPKIDVSFNEYIVPESFPNKA